MKRSMALASWWALAGGAMVVTACASPSMDTECTPGTRDCPCSEQGCVGTLTCVDAVCIDPNAEDTAQPGSDDASSDDASQDGGAPDDGPDSSPSGPSVIDFGANVTRLTDGESVTFTATVIDPDGPSDIQGGSLKTGDGALTYGPFEDIGNGTFGLRLTWSELHQTVPIEFDDEGHRDFRAEFFDNSGHRAWQSLEITLHCDDIEGVAACDGHCVGLDNNDEHCGGCGNACDDDASCTAGTCFVDWSPCLERNEVGAEVTTCAAYCESIGEACATGCEGGQTSRAWVDPGCVGPPNASSASETACGVEVPRAFESAQCCCTDGAALP